jgi:hypothetical protein
MVILSKRTRGDHYELVVDSSPAGVLKCLAGTTARHKDGREWLNLDGGTEWARLDGYSPTISPPPLGVTTDNWNPTGLASARSIRISDQGDDHTLTGVVAQEDRKVVIVFNTGPSKLTLADEGLGSDPENRFALGQNLELLRYHCIILVYDGAGARWNAVQFNQ